MSFPINIKNIFLLGSFYCIYFFLLYWSKSSVAIYSGHFSFGVYFFIFGIVYYFFQGIGKKVHQNIAKGALMSFIIFFIISFYIKDISMYLPYMLLGLFFLLSISDVDFQYKQNFKTDIIVIGLFFLIFIPIVSTYFLGPEKNIVLLLGTLSFIISYTGYNLIILNGKIFKKKNLFFFKKS